MGLFSMKDTMRGNGAIRRYWAGTSTKYLTPKSFTKINNSNIHGQNGAEFVIVTHSDFKFRSGAAEKSQRIASGEQKTFHHRRGSRYDL